MREGEGSERERERANLKCVSLNKKNRFARIAFLDLAHITTDLAELCV